MCIMPATVPVPLTSVQTERALSSAIPRARTPEPFSRGSFIAGTLGRWLRTQPSLGPMEVLCVCLSVQECVRRICYEFATEQIEGSLWGIPDVTIQVAREEDKEAAGEPLF